MNNAIAPVPKVGTEDSAIILRPVGNSALLKAKIDIIAHLRETVMQKDVHYGPPYEGSKKDVLLKPGAELLVSYFGLRPYYLIRTEVERWDAHEPLFHYRYECQLYDILTNLLVGTGIGSCNSLEAKYRWRWVEESKLPPYLEKASLEYRAGAISEFAFSIDKGETTGQYGKPAEYWQRFRDAIQNGTARQIKRKTKAGKELDAWEIGGTVYQVPNDDVFSMVNTIDKQAQKRSLVASTLVTTGASSLFTQDVEDFKGHKYFGDPDAFEIDTGEGNFTVVMGSRAVEPPDTPVLASQPPAQPPTSTPQTLPEVKHWSQTPDVWNTFVTWLTTKRNMTVEAAQQLLGITDFAERFPDDGTEASMKAAAKAACQAIDDVLNQQPAKPRGKQQDPGWTDESALDFDEWIVANFGILPSEMVRAVDKKNWRTDFKSPAAARKFVDAETQKRQIPFVCTKVQYNEFAKGKAVDFHGPEGLVVKMPGGPNTIREKLGDDGEAFAAHNHPEAWKVGEVYPIDPLKVIWTVGKNNRLEVSALKLVRPYEVSEEEAPAGDDAVDLHAYFEQGKEEAVSTPT